MSSKATGSCPGRDELARALADDDPALGEHVEACARCQERLSTLLAESGVVRELRELSHPLPRAAVCEAPEIEGFEIVRELHRGGQGIVYEALVRATGRRVAVKALLAGRWATSKDVRRFEREVELVATLDHPHIITLYDAGRASDGSPYYSMELLDGTPLDRYVKMREEEGRTLSLDERLELFLAVGGAVEYAHRHGVIHRDLKPSNILIVADGTPCVLHFGLAKSLAPGAELTLTRTGDFVGSPAWAAPEQVRGAPGAVDTRTDVYALGLILYRLVTGHHAYPLDGSLMSVVDHVLHTPPTPLRRYGLKRNADLEAILRRALEKDPDERYASVGALLDDCRRLRRGATVVARRSSAARAWRTLRRHPWLSVGAAVVFTTLTTATVLARRRVALLEFQRVREVATSTLGDDRAQFRSERQLWEAVLTGVPYRGETANGAFPAALPFHWSLRSYYRRVPMLSGLVVPGASGVLVHPTRDELLVLGRERVLVSATLPDLELSDLPARLRDASRIDFGPDASATIVVQGDRLEVHADGAGSPWIVPVDARKVERFGMLDDVQLALQDSDRLSVWDIRRRAPVAELERENGQLVLGFGHALVQRGDGLFVVGDDDELPVGSLTTIAFSPNQRHALLRNAAGVFLWEGLEQAPVRIDSDIHAALHVSNDGHWVAHSTGSRIRVLDLRDREHPRELLLVGHTRPVRRVEWSASSRYLVSCDSLDELIVWEPEPRWSRQRGDAGGTLCAVHALDVRPDGGVAVAGLREDECQASILREGAPTPTFSRLGGRFSGCAFLDDTTLVLSGRGALYVWNVNDPPPEQPRYRLPDDVMVSHIALSPDQEVLAAVDDNGVLRLFEVEELRSAEDVEPSFVLDRYLGTRMSSVGWSPESRYAVAPRPSGGFVWFDRATSSARLPDASQATPERCVAFHPTRKFFATGNDHGGLRFWDSATCRLLGEIQDAHGGKVFALAFDRSGALLCSADAVGKIRIWYVAERPDLRPETLPVPVFSFDTPHSEVFDVAFVGSDRLLSGGSVVELMEWNFAGFDRYIAGNLERWVERLGEVADPERVARMRAWKAGREDGAGD